MAPITARFTRAAVTVIVLLTAGACAVPSTAPATEQPALERMAAPYADDLRAMGISRLFVYGDPARVRVTTEFGEVYFRYPAGLAPTQFTLSVGQQAIEANSDAFNAGNSAQYEAAMKAVLPEAIRRTNVNNIQEIQQRMSPGGGGG